MALTQGIQYTEYGDSTWGTISKAAWFGGSLTAVSLAAVWASLGSGRLWLRLLVLAVVPGAAGAGLRLLQPHWEGLRWFTNWEAETLGWWLVAWTYLCAGFLAALLLVFRGSGYRLMRRQRPAASKTDEQSNG